MVSIASWKSYTFNTCAPKFHFIDLAIDMNMEPLCSSEMPTLTYIDI